MAYLIQTDSKNLAQSIGLSMVRVPRGDRRYNLHAIRSHDRLFLLETDSKTVFGPFKPSGKVREEKNPESGPFNGGEGRERHYIFERLDLDCSSLYPKGVPLGRWCDGRADDFFLDGNRENRILEELCCFNTKREPLVIALDGGDERVGVTVIGLSGKTSIASYPVKTGTSFLPLMRRELREAEELLWRGSDGEFILFAQKIGEKIYDKFFDSTPAEPLFDEGGFSVAVAGDGYIERIPFELAFREEFIFRKNIMSFRGRGESERDRRRTSQKDSSVRRVLIIADPAESCERAYEEGMELLSELEKRGIEADLLSRPLKPHLFGEYLSRYDIVHFAGHNSDGSAGWDIGGSSFGVDDLSASSLPSLVFMSTCGNTLGMGFDLLQRGVKNTVSSRWRIPDRDMCPFILLFYRYLSWGFEIGYALNRALNARFEKDDVLPLLFILQGEAEMKYDG